MSTPHTKMSRAARHGVARPSAAESAAVGAEHAVDRGIDHPVDADETSATVLAEALLRATQALKSTGRHCGEEADPMLRAISLPRGRVLMAMAEAGDERVRMGDLSGALGVTARNITTIVDGLEREGLIARRRDPTDRRAILLELTRKAHEHLTRVHALHRGIAERFFAPLDAGERHELLRLLGRVLNGCDASESVTRVDRRELTDETWARLAPLFPSRSPARGRARGRPAHDHRRILEGILWFHRSGASWRDLPERYGPWQTAANRFYRWRAAGAWDRILTELRRTGEVDWEEHDLTGDRPHP